ncbi:unnamed protein product [Withania somnifera]
MPVASGFAASFAVAEAGGNFNYNYLSSTSCSSSSLNCFRHHHRRIKPLVYCPRSHSLSPRCEASSNPVAKSGDKESRTSSLSALELLKTSAVDRYTKKSSSITVIGLNINTAPVEVRKKVSIPEAQWPQAIQAAVLSTCNRIEIYVLALAQNRGIKEVTEWMSKFSRVPVTELCQHRFFLYNQDATQHLFEVAAGLDSLVLGEGQNFAQVKQTNISSGSVSVSSAAVELAFLKLPEYSSSARMLIVGAGKMGKLVIKHLVAKRCKKMVVVNRTEDRVAAIHEELTDADIIYKPFSEMLACAAQVDVIFTCTASNTPLFIKESVQALPSVNSEACGRRLFIDISVPRNVEPCVSELEGACVYNVDDLKEVAEANMEDRLRKKMDAETIIAEEVKQFEAFKDSLETLPTIKKLRAYAERIRAAEVDKCLCKMGDDLPENKKKAVYDLSLGIVNKLLQGPMQHLKCDGTENRTLSEILENMHALNRIFVLDAETSVLEEKIRAKIEQNQKQSS